MFTRIYRMTKARDTTRCNVLPFVTKWGKEIMYMHGYKYLDIPGRKEKQIVIMLPLGRTGIKGGREKC